LAVAQWNSSHPLRSYHEALRDRLITYFEVRNMTHKPKLVAVTSCSPGAGVSSVAAGLAATLSETGDGNVLLVDMNVEHGAAHPFFQGKPAIGLGEALDAEDRQPAQVRENLYAVSASVTNGSLTQALPKRFSSLIPRFKASDYDYIIFDMPPVTQTSLTPRLSSYMDMVLLVLEAEKTSLGIAGKAVELLRESRASVAAVLNRKRKYVPSWLLEEF
jgi:Mrp family chromosome partitioning ATPase